MTILCYLFAITLYFRLILDQDIIFLFLDNTGKIQENLS